MYVRRISTTLADGTKAGYLQLAHKVRDPETGVPRDVVLPHFGREESIDQDQLRRLIKSISRFLEPEDRIEVQAQLEGFDSEVTAERSLPFGGSYVLDRLWQRLEIDQTLETLLAERDYEIDIERLLFALVANRALDPRSKLGLESVQVHTLYRSMDFLLEHAEATQQAVFWQAASLLKLEVDLVSFDTTSTDFELAEPDEDGLRRYGHSKDHRPDLPQAVIGLAVTRSGIPVRCWVWPGNTADASVVDEVRADLAGWKLSRVVSVVDQGIVSTGGKSP